VSDLQVSFSQIGKSSPLDKLEWRRQVLIIIANRFGMKNVDPDYYPSIKKFMKLPSFVGLIGGKPNYAYYFCGLVEPPTEN
jgi:cysteine protease ATG4